VHAVPRHDYQCRQGCIKNTFLRVYCPFKFFQGVSAADSRLNRCMSVDKTWTSRFGGVNPSGRANRQPSRHLETNELLDELITIDLRDELRVLLSQLFTPEPYKLLTRVGIFQITREGSNLGFVHCAQSSVRRVRCAQCTILPTLQDLHIISYTPLR
jgi:hypothetical protein